MVPAYPVTLSVQHPQHNNRLLGLLGIFGSLKQLLLLPHIFVIFFLAIWFGIITWINFWAILFTGHGIASVQRFQHGFLQWAYRLACWFVGLTDQYPPFSLETA